MTHPAVSRLLALAVLLAAPLLGQSPDVDQERTAGVSPHPSAAEARLLLALARKAQCPEGVPPAIASFEGRFQVTAREYGAEGAPRETGGRVVQYWVAPKKDGEARESRYRRELETDLSEGRLVLVCERDGFCWRRKLDPGGKKGPIVPLSGLEYEKDRKELRAEKRRVDELFRLFVLESLPVDETTLKVSVRGRTLEQQLGSRRFTPKATMVSFRDLEGHAFELWLDDETRHPVRARVLWKGATSWERFEMAQHYPTLLPDGRKLFVPCNVVYYDTSDRPIFFLATEDPKEAFGFNRLDAKTERRLFPIVE